jgi:glycerol-3-phosphate dehydrogenase (NAD(P)+)
MTGSICVIGAGSWGTALALTACRAGAQNVTLITRRLEQAETLIRDRQNKQYLPGIEFPHDLTITNDFMPLKQADIVLQVTPAQSLKATCEAIGNILPADVPWVICAKGIMRGTEMADPELLSTVSQKILPNPVVILSGPSFAEEVGQNLPTAITIASHNENAANQVCKSLRHSRFRCYASDDPVGVQVAGAVKNVLAIACGIVVGKKLGKNAAAAVMTRGLAEIRRLGLALGGKKETLLGLSGVGDVSLSCASEQSRNMRLGKLIGESNFSPKTILENCSFITEGVSTVEAVYNLSRKLNLSMPLSRAVYSLLYEDHSVDEIIEQILSRQSQTEFEL